MRLQLALDVSDIDEAVEFYSKLFDAEPCKRKPGYANFAIENPPLKLVLFENPDNAGGLNHLGVETETSQQVEAAVVAGTVNLREANRIARSVDVAPLVARASLAPNFAIRSRERGLALPSQPRRDPPCTRPARSPS